jgi:hypothetical protein
MDNIDEKNHFNIPHIADVRKLTLERPGYEVNNKMSVLDSVRSDIQFLISCIVDDASDGKNCTSTEFLRQTVDHPLYQEFIVKLFEAGYNIKIANSPCGLVEISWDGDAKLTRYDYY